MRKFGIEPTEQDIKAELDACKTFTDFIQLFADLTGADINDGIAYAKSLGIDTTLDLDTLMKGK